MSLLSLARGAGVAVAGFLREHATAQEVLRAIPAAGGAAVAWLTLNKLVALATLGYVVLQAAYLMRKWWREEKDLRKPKRRKP